MKIKNLFAAAAVATMLVAPVTANAGTVAGASIQGVKPVLSAAGTEYRASRSVKKEQNLTAAGVVIGGIALGAAIFGIVKAVDDGKSNG